MATELKRERPQFDSKGCLEGAESQSCLRRVALQIILRSRPAALRRRKRLCKTYLSGINKFSEL